MPKYRPNAIAACSKIVSKSFFGPAVKGYRVYAAKDRKNKTAANTTTINKFGPSGSLKSANVPLEMRRDVITNISSEVFFDMKCILLFYYILSKLCYVPSSKKDDDLAFFSFINQPDFK
jgi:hypothetical protein